MRWLQKHRLDRQNEVSNLIAKIEQQSPDRFWLSNDQDGIDTQEMRILLPAGQDTFYNIHIMTSQLYAARNAAQELGQLPGERIAITPRLLDMTRPESKEIFVIDHDHEDGVGLFIAVNADGLTHDPIDYLLSTFIDNNQQPLTTGSISENVLANRLIEARENNKHAFFKA